MQAGEPRAQRRPLRALASLDDARGNGGRRLAGLPAHLMGHRRPGELRDTVRGMSEAAPAGAGSLRGRKRRAWRAADERSRRPPYTPPPRRMTYSGEGRTKKTVIKILGVMLVGLFVIAMVGCAAASLDAKEQWTSTATYPSGFRVAYNNLVYQSLQNNNLDNVPSTSTAWWKDIGTWSGTYGSLVNLK